MATSSEAASVLVTSLVERAGRAVSCSLLNLGKKEIEVRTDAVQFDGTADSTVNWTIAPGQGRSGGGYGPAAGEDQVYCRFEVTGTSKKKVRAAICVHEAGIGSACMSSSEAR